MSMKTLNVQGIVFDLDATLVNLGGFVEWRKAHEDIVESYLEMDCDNETVQVCSAKGLFNMLDEMYVNLLDEKGKDSAMQVQGTAYDILSNYEQKGVESCTLMDGCFSTLEWIKEKGVPMGICTSNATRTAMAALKLQGLEDFFDAVIGRVAGIPMKPHPAQLKECFRLLEVEPSNGVMIGDSHKDIIAGKMAGAYTVGIPVYFTKLDLMKEAGVDVIIDSLLELPTVLTNL